MDRLSLRAWLAVLLVGSAFLFFVGIYLERGVVAVEPLAAAEPSSQPEASPAEGGGETGHSEAPAASAETAGETVEQHAVEARPFGIDMESPLPVGAAIVVSVLLAGAVLQMKAPIVGVAIVLFAVIIALFDLLEVSFQLGAARPGLALIASVLVVMHVMIGLIAVRLFQQERGGQMAAR